ncbi:MAG TPA: ferredoxin [Cyanobacteria bacterium UBA8530]|nr:ferredoxin [Cyanobacteria bacterium UBA8530]
MQKIKLSIDGKPLEALPGTSVLEAAKAVGIDIPTLCYLKGIQAIGACRVCLIEVDGFRTLQAACVFPVAEGMVVRTNTSKVREARKFAVELILADHPFECLTCSRNLHCELQDLANQMGIDKVPYAVHREALQDHSTPALVRDNSKCILCQRCVSVCHEVQGVGALGFSGRGFKTQVAPAFEEMLGDVACTQCGQCAMACPVGAITEKNDLGTVWNALADKTKHVVVQTAPAVRVALGEEFGMAPGTIVTGKMVAALRQIGFDRVFDTDFSADLTIIEEGHELLGRLKSGKLPMITSCSPGWIKYIEHFYPEMLAHLSTCKSPQQMFGAVAKSYYAEMAGIKPEDIFVVSIMPCTAKKYERQRPEMIEDVDAVLTTRELAKMIKQAGIDFPALADEEYDLPFGIGSGAGVIFGATGGVMEAALRTVYEVVTGQTLPKIDLVEVRGLEGIKEATVMVGDLPVKVAVAHGLSNAKRLLDRIKAGEADHQFIEVMCCPGGCLGGGGQPIPTTDEIRLKRSAAIYQADKDLPIRKSHENPAVKKLYQDYLGEPNGEKAHHLLHTHYTERTRY